MPLWSCITCSKTFSRKGDLTRHELLHTGVKPHVCKTCGKGFAQFSGLKTHWNVHSKDKPYICGIGTCKKAFGDPSSCTRHRKETHRREGGYKCFVDDCGTKIKRRSTFAAHLRKHGFDTKLLDLEALTLPSGRAVPPPVQFAQSYAEDSLQHKVESRSPSPLVHSESSSSKSLDTRRQMSHFVDDSRLSDDDSLDCQQASQYVGSPLGNGALPLVSRVLALDQSAKGDPSRPPTPLYELYRYPPGNDHPFYFDEVFPTAIDYQFFDASPLQIPVLEPFLEVGSDVSASSSSSPLSTYSLLYHSDSLEDIDLSSLTSNASQELLLYSIV